MYEKANGLFDFRFYFYKQRVLYLQILSSEVYKMSQLKIL